MDLTPSRPVHSSQRGPHPGLGRLVRRHLHSNWLEPIHPGSREAWRRFLERHRQDQPLVLDSGCGTGASTALLARRHPDALVVGIDRSAARLARAPREMPANTLLLRARCEDFWRLLHAAGIRPAVNYLLYPNPWPKPAHLARRWHGHPVFPTLPAPGGALELRCNWRIYAEEFRLAARICGIDAPSVVSFQPEAPLTPFERKYSASGHRLYRLHLEGRP